MSLWSQAWVVSAEVFVSAACCLALLAVDISNPTYISEIRENISDQKKKRNPTAVQLEAMTTERFELSPPKRPGY
ncbi:hypothetical protein B0I72DRAFT_143201 [Yarrowia lipolytica]|uniref:Uncharacterized protein n=1 Tax=Yarrowia lipolytica TaxID=4952 RepID=A0A371C7E1_YARLL|nr:hypothetical protein B0I71DRAFT_131225 [Yarrowia lipolytica]RDW29440.1 hypothetical protein B0I72DRAFT_143201 [Yarrowia lipolytica]RDW43177.1 hypothetical protein B0I74DRAFT_142471 [Yarrowia lipolytica]RDW49950.1 hypothetical protein B0I75DRAFT_142292 [Yarrowia lipolytica]